MIGTAEMLRQIQESTEARYGDDSGAAVIPVPRKSSNEG